MVTPYRLRVKTRVSVVLRSDLMKLVKKFGVFGTLLVFLLRILCAHYRVYNMTITGLMDIIMDSFSGGLLSLIIAKGCIKSFLSS